MEGIRSVLVITSRKGRGRSHEWFELFQLYTVNIKQGSLYILYIHIAMINEGNFYGRVEWFHVLTMPCLGWCYIVTPSKSYSASWGAIYIYICIPGAQMTNDRFFWLDWKLDLVLEGSTTKIEDEQISGIYIYIFIFIVYEHFRIIGEPPPHLKRRIGPRVPSVLCLENCPF